MRCVENESLIACEQPISNRLTLQYVRRICGARIRKFLKLISGKGGCEATAVTSATGKKEYHAPVARKLTPEQAALLLVGHATVGDQGAKELMELVFPEPSKLIEPRHGSVGAVAVPANN